MGDGNGDGMVSGNLHFILGKHTLSILWTIEGEHDKPDAVRDASAFSRTHAGSR